MKRLPQKWMIAAQASTALAVFVCFAAVLTMTANAVSHDCNLLTRPGVYLYEGANFQGRCTRFESSLSSLSITEVGNDRASSIRIVGNFTVTLYLDRDFEGDDSSFFAGDDPNFGNDPIGHDRASSIRVRQRPGICDVGEGVYLFEHERCEGRASAITEDIRNLSTLNIGTNNASSLAIFGPYALTLYQSTDFLGQSSTFIGSDFDLDDETVGNDTASSARIRESHCDDEPGVYVYQHANFSGRCSRFRASVPNLSIEYILNNEASSLRIIGDYVVGVYRFANFGGANHIFTSDENDFDDTLVGNDTASAVRVIASHNLCDGEPGVYLYQSSNFQGPCTKFLDDARSLDIHLVGSDRASSIRIVGGYVARVFADTGLRGASSRFSADDANLADNNIGDNRASSIRVVGPNPEQERIFRLQLRLTTADVSDAGTDDAVMASLNPVNVTWLDYGVIEDYDGPQGDNFERFDGDDFERGESFTYDLLPTGVSLFNDIDWITLSKTGSNGWCVSRVELLVNDRSQAVFTRSFNPCRWLDNEGGSRRTLSISSTDLRAGSPWSNFNQNLGGAATIPDHELISRIHSVVGDAIKDNQGYWGKLQGNASVEVAGAALNSVHVDLDLAADILGPDAEVDIDFDIVLTCDAVNNPGVINMNIENFDVEADFDNLFELFFFWLENRIEGEIQDGFPPISQPLSTGLSRCPDIFVSGDGSILFGLP